MEIRNELNGHEGTVLRDCGDEYLVYDRTSGRDVYWRKEWCTSVLEEIAADWESADDDRMEIWE